jgi:site-specific recombinase XerD
MSVLDHLISNVAFDRAISEFLMELRIGNRSKKTIYYYRCHLNDFVKMRGDIMVADTSIQDIRQFLAEKADKPWVMNARYVSLRAFFNWSVRQRYAISNLVEQLPVPKKPKKVIPTIDVQDFKSLLACCAKDTYLGKRNRAILLMFYDTGIRLEELASLTLRDIDIEQGLIKVKGKGQKERIVRIGDTSKRALWDYLRIRGGKGEGLWLTEERRPITTSTVVLTLRKLEKRTGISCSAHKFRHTFAINMLRQGCNVFELQQMLGHSSLEMVKNYTRTLNNDDAIKAHIKFSPVDRLI